MVPWYPIQAQREPFRDAPARAAATALERGREALGDWGVPAAFMGAFTNKVDRKGRVSVPAPFRAAIGTGGFQGIVAMRSIRDGVDAIEAFAHEAMSRLSESLTEPFAPSGDVAGGLFMEAVEVPFDGEGRIVLPEPLRAFARIDDQATFLGRGPYFHIWEPRAGAEYRERLFRQLRTERGSLNLSLKGTSGGAS